MEHNSPYDIFSSYFILGMIIVCLFCCFNADLDVLAHFELVTWECELSIGPIATDT